MSATNEGIFICVDVLVRETGVSEDRCYEALKTTIYHNDSLSEIFPSDSIQQVSPRMDNFSDNLEKLASAVVFAKRLINSGFF